MLRIARKVESSSTAFKSFVRLGEVWLSSISFELQYTASNKEKEEKILFDIYFTFLCIKKIQTYIIIMSRD